MPDERRNPLSLVHRVRLPSVVASPPARPPLLLLLHGVGANELAMASLAGAFDPRFIVISARAPIELEPYQFAWFHTAFTPEGPTVDRDEAKAAWDHVARFIDEAVAAYSGDPSGVFVVGFSQGGIVALATMLTAPERLAGAVCMSGQLPEEVVRHAVSTARLRDKPVLVVHGTRDETIDVGHGRGAFETLQRFPLALEYREFDIAHTTSDESVAAVSAWLTGRLRSGPP
jgi:phospholipase/carboxylesterase